jgi:hypothetical protein
MSSALYILYILVDLETISAILEIIHLSGRCQLHGESFQYFCFPNMTVLFRLRDNKKAASYRKNSTFLRSVFAESIRGIVSIHVDIVTHDLTFL